LNSDKLIGVQSIVKTRRAKFVAISGLTDDYLDTTGYVHSVEGQLGNMNLESADLESLIAGMGQFGFGSGEMIASTFIPPVRSEYETAADWKYRFMQYVRTHNDRAAYSLACIVDGVCPVNFKNQITVGQT
jgi:hypothetical protein